MLYQLGTLLALALLVGAIALAGAGLEAVLRLRLVDAKLGESASAIDRWLIRFALGAGFSSLVLFAFAATGLLLVPALWLLAIASAIAGALALARNREVLWGPPALDPGASSTALSPARTQRWIGAGVGTCLGAGLGLVAIALLLQALRPDVSWDANVYHLTLPKLFLDNGGFFRVPFNVYSNWPLGVELLFALAMGLRDHVLAKLLHFAFGALTAVAVYRLAGARAGLLATTFYLFNSVVLYEMRIAYVDLAYAFFFVLAVWSLSDALDREIGSRGRRRSLLLSALLAGALCSVKLSGFFGLLVLVVVWLADSLLRRNRTPARDRTPARSQFAEIVILCGPALLFGAPWLVKSLVLTGNPTYPLFYGWFGGPEWSQLLADQHALWQRSIGMGRGVVDYLLLPFRVVLFGDLGYPTFDGRIHRAWIVLVPLALLGAGRDRQARRFLLACGSYFALWSVTSQQMRFLIPVLPLLSIVAARGFRIAVARLRASSRSVTSATLASAIEAGVAIAAALLLIQASWVYIAQSPHLGRDLLIHGADLKTAVVRPVYRFIDEELPKDARLLLINTNHGFFVQRDFVADSFFEASQVADAFADANTTPLVVAELQELGLTHALVENRPGPAYPESLVQLLQDPELATPVYRSPDGRFVVLAFSPGAGE